MNVIEENELEKTKEDMGQISIKCMNKEKIDEFAKYVYDTYGQKVSADWIARIGQMSLTDASKVLDEMDKIAEDRNVMTYWN